MLTRYFFRISPLILLLVFTVSCTSSRTVNLPTVQSTNMPIMPTYTPTLTEIPVATQKSPQSSKTPELGKGDQSKQANDASQNMSFDVPAHAMDVILGRPTTNSIAVTLLVEIFV